MNHHPGRFVAIFLAVLSSAVPPASAQSSVAALSPAAGAWGTELNYGGANGLSLLHFASPTRVWLFGAFASVGIETTDQPTSPTTLAHSSETISYVNLRAGHRWYSGSAADRLRPLVELGLVGGEGQTSDSKTWDGGGYADFGATYFFTPHVSLGGAGELSFMRTHQRHPAFSPGGPDFVQDSKTLNANLIHFQAAVYF